MYSLSADSRKKTRNMLMNDEGFKDKPYYDSKGKMTIGFGFNLDSNGLPMSIALEWLDLLISEIDHNLGKNFHFWNDLNEPRKCVLINMAYQLGIGGLLKFRGMINMLGSKDYVGAANEMKDSVWYREFTTRASKLVKIMQYGEF